jgi:hypothetical protein
MGAPADIPTSRFTAHLGVASPGKRDRGWFVALRVNVAETLLKRSLTWGQKGAIMRIAQATRSGSFQKLGR